MLFTESANTFSYRHPPYAASAIQNLRLRLPGREREGSSTVDVVQSKFPLSRHRYEGRESTSERHQSVCDAPEREIRNVMPALVFAAVVCTHKSLPRPPITF
jgi:hypothetical protein